MYQRNRGSKTRSPKDFVRPIQRMCTGKLRLITLICLFSLVLLFLTRSFMYSVEQVQKIQSLDVNSVDYLENVHAAKDLLNYAVIIDAGSSGSRAHIYVWPPHMGDKRTLLQVRMLKDKFGHDIYKRISPGLSSNAKHPEKSFEYIYPLLQFAMEHIPKNKLRETPLYILATAGMRLLSLEAQKKIIANLQENIPKNCTFNFSPSNVQVITGQQEGIYSWISINYLLERFDHSMDTNYLTSINLNGVITTRPRTAGMLEIGGASMQIAFEITNKYELEEIKQEFNETGANYLAQFNLGCDSHDTDHSYLLYVATYLGLGANMGKKSYVHHLFHEYLQQHDPHIHYVPPFDQMHSESGVNGNRSVRALPDSFKNHLNTSDAAKPFNFFSQDVKNSFLPVPELEIADPCLPLNARTKENATDHNGNRYHVTLVGLGDFEQCEQKVSLLLNPKSERHLNCSNEENCPLSMLSKLRVPFQNAELFGFSEFWYSMEDILRIGGLYNYFKFKEAASEYCKTDWKILEARHQKGLYPKADKNRMLQECFKSAWITSILHTGFRMPKTFNNFRSALKIRNNEVQWTLGALIYRTRFFPLKDIQQHNRVAATRVNPSFIHNDNESYVLGHVLFIFSMLTVLACILIYLRNLNRLVNQSAGVDYCPSLDDHILTEVKIMSEPLLRSEA